MNTKIKLVIRVIVVITAIVGARLAHDKLTELTVQLPEYPPIEKVVWLDQNWSQEQRDWFHHADQGTQTFGIPYEWFVALEQPELSFTTPGLLSDPTYLDRYGFISAATKTGKSQLPVGFAHGSLMLDGNGSPWRNPRSNVEMGELRRQSQNFWSRGRGARRLSMVSAQVGSAPGR
jgi:hypothetical protein